MDMFVMVLGCMLFGHKIELLKLNRIKNFEFLFFNLFGFGKEK